MDILAERLKVSDDDEILEKCCGALMMMCASQDDNKKQVGISPGHSLRPFVLRSGRVTESYCLLAPAD